MNEIGHVFVNKKDFKRGQTEFGGRTLKSITYKNDEYVNLKDLMLRIGYTAKISQVSRRIPRKEAIRIYEERLKTTFVRLGYVNDLMCYVRGSNKIQHVITTGTVRGNGVPLSPEELARRRAKRKAARENKALALEIGVPESMSKYKAAAMCKERALIRRRGMKTDGVKFRYVNYPRFNVEAISSVKDYVPARFEGNINLAF